MLNITGLNRFFFVRDFHDMRCKYDKVLSIIHQQLDWLSTNMFLTPLFIVKCTGCRVSQCI